MIFDQNHGLTSLHKCKFSGLFKSVFFKSRTACFLSRKSPNTLSRPNLPKTKRYINQFEIFDQSHGLTRMENANFDVFMVKKG